MSIIYVCEMKKEKPENEATINVIEEITQEELNTLNQAFSFTSDYHSITQILNIVLENGNEFKKWMNPQNLQKSRNEGASSERLILISNKLVLNYATSTKTFIDMMRRLLQRKEPDCVEHFLGMTNKFYDENMEYRFWSNFRNYVVHCSFPYSVFHEAVDCNCEVRCTREHLLEFDNWKHSRVDIQKMSEFINLPDMVDKMNSLIYALYLQYFYYIFKDFVADYEIYRDFMKRHSVKCPVILKTDRPISKEEGFVSPNMQPLPVKEMMEIFKVMQQHPSININFLNEK